MALRRKQIRNLFCLLMLANGTPMFCAADEFMNTQQGNNNPYNQDNEITWLDWDFLDKNAEMFRLFKFMIAFRKAHPSIGRVGIGEMMSDGMEQVPKWIFPSPFLLIQHNSQ